MPLVKIEATKEIPADVRSEVSMIAAETIGKPEAYVMVSATESQMTMSGAEDSAAFIDVRSIGGLSHSVCEQLSQKICGLFDEKLGIPSNRVYLNFTEVPAGQWGWNGSLFK